MNREIANIVWKPFFAAFMTGLLSFKGMNPLLVGTVLGIAAAVSCYYEIKKMIARSANKLEQE